MKVFVHPADHWFSYYLIEALLLEGYEVFTLQERNEVTEDDFTSDEKMLLDFGRNSNFKMVQEKPNESFSHGIFLEKRKKISFEQGLFLTNQPITDQLENMTTVSTAEIDFIENDNRSHAGDSSKKTLSARTVAQWLVIHGLSDEMPQVIILHGDDDKKSIFFIN